ncbi:MAG: tRNA 2-thiouridine(34) synthase MnmA [Phycisphaerales bacterium]|nr:tRNA 2-thiouridine(34) synthase MnmA [Phycisphaerales bacterium]
MIAELPKSRVLVAMSGGVDSSVCAAMLARSGHDVVGVFMRLGSVGETLDGVEREAAHEGACLTAIGGARAERRVTLTQAAVHHRGCCSVSDAADARQVAAELGIPLYVANFKKDFGRIIDYFVDEYASGRTPNPCVRCNDWLKFGRLHDYALELGCDFVASGHYARTTREVDGAHSLRRGVDHAKDQSYVLFGVDPAHVARMLLPIGEMKKDDVRGLAREWGLPVFDKPDSQEICFVPDDDYAGLVERARPDLARPGAIVDETGANVGTHAGQHRFTIGQRRGLGVQRDEPGYVVSRDPASNIVTIGPASALDARSCVAHEANWLVTPPASGAWRACLAQHRAHGEALPARVRVLGDVSEGTPSGRRGAFEVAFDAPERALAPGQAIVLYDADDTDRVIAGGWIARVGS